VVQSYQGERYEVIIYDYYKSSWRQVEDADIMWDAMTKCIRMLAKEVLGTSRRGGGRMKGAWWWNVEVKEKVKMKKRDICYFHKQ